MRPQKYKVIILSAAIDEFKDIIHYVKAYSPQNAEMLKNEIYSKISDLKSFPRRYSIETDIKKTEKDVRSFSHKNIKIVYQIFESDVIVLSILHSKRGPGFVSNINTV